MSDGTVLAIDVLAICTRLEETFDPGGALPEDGEEWAKAHMEAITELRELAEAALTAVDIDDHE